jgi:hypothetical protein
MKYIDFVVGAKTYKLRLNTRGLVALEKDLGKNPLFLFMNKANNNTPTVEEMTLVLFHALKVYQPEITLEQTFDLYDEWIEEGHLFGELSNVIVELFIISGVFKIPEKN